jgi:hypothetical protein
MSVAVRRGRSLAVLRRVREVLDHLDIFLRGAVSNYFLARLEHFVQIFLRVGAEQSPNTRSFKEPLIACIANNVNVLVQGSKSDKVSLATGLHHSQFHPLLGQRFSQASVCFSNCLNRSVYLFCLFNVSGAVGISPSYQITVEDKEIHL